MKEKILVWLSGWVDSAVSAYLLKKSGYDLTAGFMINYLAPEWEYCPTREDIEVAREVAKFLEIPFFTFDYREDYEKKVLNYMYESYKRWITPNPDIMCNSEIKFRVFLDEAMELGFDKVATWHYARIEESVCLDDNSKKNNIYHLLKWVDSKKDQSYFLAWLNQFQLSKTLFPIWHLEKSEVRKLALEIWLPNAKRKDSQWICFVWKVDMKKFLEKKIKPKVWNIVNTSWLVLWKHNWVFYYTIWQRKGLDIWWLKDPVFVIKKDLEKNELIVWTKDDIKLYSDSLLIKNMHFLNSVDKYKFPLKLKAKIRYRQEDQDCLVDILDNWDYIVRFYKSQRAIASGQICAFYQDDELLMSWVIF